MSSSITQNILLCIFFCIFALYHVREFTLDEVKENIGNRTSYRNHFVLYYIIMNYDYRADMPVHSWR